MNLIPVEVGMPSEVNSPTVRAGAYARYSSDHQRDASIDDQVRICRTEIERHGWDLVQVYADPALRQPGRATSVGGVCDASRAYHAR